MCEGFLGVLIRQQFALSCQWSQKSIVIKETSESEAGVLEGRSR